MGRTTGGNPLKGTTMAGMDERVVGGRAPLPVEVEAGKTYYWCACGRSAKQPFCDGSHKATAMTPIAFTAEKSEKLWLCGCKQSGGAPRCDGTHKSLPEG